MKKRWIVLLATVMLFAFAAGAVAGPAVQDITASLANDIKITLNGDAWTPWIMELPWLYYLQWQNLFAGTRSWRSCRSASRLGRSYPHRNSR